MSHARSNALRIVCGGLKTVGAEDQDAIICTVVAASLFADVTWWIERFDDFMHRPTRPPRRKPGRPKSTPPATKETP